MKFFREEKDGTKALHYGSLALIGFGLFAIFVVVKLATADKQNDFFGKAKSVVKSKDLSSITRPASQIQQIESQQKKEGQEEISQRGLTNETNGGPAAKTNSASSTFDNSILSGAPETAEQASGSAAQTKDSGGIDSINIALRTAYQSNGGAAPNATGKPLLNEGGLTSPDGGAGSPDSASANGSRYFGLNYQNSNPNRGGGASAAAAGNNATNTGHPESGTYFDFRGPASQVSSTQVNSAGSGNRSQAASVSRLKPIIHGLPPGTLFPVYVITKIETSSEALASPVEFAIAAPITFNHRYQIPWGTRMQGHVTNSFRNRIAFEVSSLLYPDGRMLPIHGEIIGEDMALGVPAYYHATPLTAQAAPYIADFITAYIQYVEQQNTSSVSLSVGGTAVNYGGTDNSPRTAAMESASKLLAQITADQVHEVEQLNAPYLFLPPYSLCYLKLIDGVDLSPIYGLDPDPIQPMQPPAQAPSPVRQLAGGSVDLSGRTQENPSASAGNTPVATQPDTVIAGLQQNQPETPAAGNKNQETSDFFGDQK